VLDNLSTGFKHAVPLVVGDSGDQVLVFHLIHEHDVQAIIHFAASLIVPDSVRNPLSYYRNNTVNTRALIESAEAASDPKRSRNSTGVLRKRKTRSSRSPTPTV
jgi:UDP-glucose 4-epimerase